MNVENNNIIIQKNQRKLASIITGFIIFSLTSKYITVISFYSRVLTDLLLFYFKIFLYAQRINLIRYLSHTIWAYFSVEIILIVLTTIHT